MSVQEFSKFADASDTDPRMLRGMQIATVMRVEERDGRWIVPSQTGDGRRYTVDLDDESCSCPDFESRGLPCKHVYAATFTRERVVQPDGTEIVRESVRVQYAQPWAIYNHVQRHEHELFLPLLRELCDGIEQPEQGMGRPRLPLSDVIFALGVRTYSGLSGRRAESFVRDAAERGYMSVVPSYGSSFRYLESPELTPILKNLIEEAAKPLAAIEQTFAIDSTGIGTTTYRRWFDAKWGRERSKQRWIKMHAMVGTTTNVITAIDATATESPDSPQLPALLNRTVETFDVQEVSGDKAYSSRSNLHAIVDAGAFPLIPFHKGSTGGHTHHGFDGLWSRMWHYYMFEQEKFAARYHRRSNAETCFHMLKSKFGASVRAKTPDAQVNEALLKALAHNIVVVIQSMAELGIEGHFWEPAPTRLRSHEAVPEVGQFPGF